MTPVLFEILETLKQKKYSKDQQWFNKWDALMIPRTEYNLNRLVDFGFLDSAWLNQDEGGLFYRLKGEGTEEGQMCNRDGCTGIITFHENDNACSCHIVAPCSSCCHNYEYCPECEWEPEQP